MKEVNLKQDSSERVKSDFFKSNTDNYSKKIQTILTRELQIAKTNLGIETFLVSNSWFEKAEKNMYHQTHNHGPLGFSAVCFIQYDDSIHTPTQFVSPFNNFVSGSVLSHSPEHIKEGSLIFFPSIIHHYTIPNDSEKERIILSFNLSNF
jgi:hypothetical protein